VSHLKFSGLGMLQKQISSVITDARSLIDHDEAKMVLRTLQDPATTAVNPTAVMKIKTAGVFTVILNHTKTCYKLNIN
jgi:hypothetical protein